VLVPYARHVERDEFTVRVPDRERRRYGRRCPGYKEPGTIMYTTPQRNPEVKCDPRVSV